MSTNPIALRSKEMFQSALLELMVHKSYEDITISCLSKNADLARRTFYRHYSNKEEVLLDIFESYAFKYTAALIESKAKNLPDISEVFFSYWINHYDFLQLIIKNKLTYLFLDKMNHYIGPIHHDVQGHFRHIKDKNQLKYALSFTVGGHFNLLMLWVEEGAQKKPSEMKHIIQTALSSYSNFNE